MSRLTGVHHRPRDLRACDRATIAMPEHFAINDNMVDLPASEDEHEQRRGAARPEHQALPVGAASDRHHGSCRCLLKVGDNITTDHIMPAGAKILPYRSNIPLPGKLLLRRRATPTSPRAPRRHERRLHRRRRATTARAPAVSTPRWCRCIWASRAVIAKSFARIHKANLMNAGILPLEFENAGRL